MNILIIGTTDILGGAAKVSWDIKAALQSRGDTVSMFVADKRSNDDGVKSIPRQMWRKYLGFLLATDDLLSSDWILETKEYKEADIIHCHNLHGRYFNLHTLQKMSQEKKVVWTLHDEWAITPHGAYTMEGNEMKYGLYVCPSKETQPRILWDNTKYLAWRKKSIYKNSTLHIVTPSLWLKERVEKTVLASQDIRCIPNGIDVTIFKRYSKEEARKKVHLPLDKIIILFLANDAKNNTWKGWKYTEALLARYAHNENMLFVSVGNHSVHQNTETVLYISHLENKEDIALYYNAADMLLFTSVAENFPLVILEALGCGLPVVSFDVGGVKEVVTHLKNGYISKYKDIDSLQEGVEYILALNTLQREQISLESSVKIQEQFTKEKMIDSYLKLYDEITH